MDDLEAEFLALLVFCDGYIFDMPDKTEVVNAEGLSVGFVAPRGGGGAGPGFGAIQFLLNDQGAGAHYPLPIVNHEQIVGSPALRVHKVIAVIVLLFCDVAHGGQHP